MVYNATSANHWAPGVVIDQPGFTATYDTTSWDLQYRFPGTFYDYQTGWDVNFPLRGGNDAPTVPIQHDGGYNGTIWQIVGQGTAVTFAGHAAAFGITIQLLQTGFSGAYGANGWVHYASSTGSADVSFTETLNLGETYYLWVTSTSRSSDTPFTRPDGSREYPYQDTITFSVDGLVPPAPPAPVNDNRADATTVSIASDGGTYTSISTDLTSATPVDHGTVAPDQDAAPLYYTVWWKYKPTVDGYVTASVGWTQSGSSTQDQIVLQAIKVNSNSSLALMGQEPQPELTYSGTVSAGTTFYFAVGLSSSSAGYPLVTLTVTGPTTAPQQNPNTYTPPVTVPPTDSYDPAATQPALDSGEDTLLNLVRIFSSEVRRAVRITGPTTIEMVDPAVPVPASVSDAPSLYHSTTHASAATDVVLSTNAGKVTVTGSADLVADDVRLVSSTWRIPDRLPVYGLPPAPIQRVTLTFSPQGFSASVDFHFPTVPLAARRP